MNRTRAQDTRRCSVCGKQPPAGQAWRDYAAHESACARAYYRQKRELADDLTAIFSRVFGGTK